MQKPSLICLSLLTLLTACNSTTVIPGSTLKTRNKTVVYTGNETWRVNKPITFTASAAATY